MIWTKACKLLWGEDWIAPLAEVLGKSRKTVERWKVGSVQIPPEVEREIQSMAPFAREDVAREYGRLLRRHARGESISDMEDWLDRYSDALILLRKKKGVSTGAAGRDRGTD
jgi:hypothetical protein